MANRDLLKEAIADAKALKETAIANAKVALEEAKTDEAKEKVEEKSDRKDGGEDKETKRTEKMKYGKDLAEAEVDEEMNLDEILAELEGDLSEDARTDAEEEGYKDGMEDEKEDMEDDEEDEEIDLDDLSEEDLKSFIEDVIADMVTAGELEAGEEFEVEDEDVEDDEEIDVEDDTEVDVEVNEVDTFNPERTGDFELDRARAKGQLEGKEEIDEADAITGLSDMAGALAMAAPALAAILGLGVAAVKDKLEKGGKEAKELVAKANAKAKSMEEGEGMDEMKKEIEELRSDLHETNLLNAKLLYTNKIFRAKNLKEAQKVKVLEAFDKASNVKEVKLIFETLNEGMVSNATRTPIKESLGSASKPAGVAKKAPIMEIDPQVARWQKLAGLK